MRLIVSCSECWPLPFERGVVSQFFVPVRLPSLVFVARVEAIGRARISNDRAKEKVGLLGDELVCLQLILKPCIGLLVNDDAADLLAG